MSKSLLYHAFGIQGYRYRRTDYEGGCVIFHLEQDRSTYRCPCCGSPEVFSRGSVQREFRHVPIGGKPFFWPLRFPECLAVAVALFARSKSPSLPSGEAIHVVSNATPCRFCSR